MAAATANQLENSWCVWEHQASKGGGDWKENMKMLGEFSTVEDFWRYFNNIPRPSQVFYDGRSKKKVGDRVIESFSLFKKGIVPAWEDPVNAKGSEYFLRLTNHSLMDSYWENLVLGLVGETVDSGDEVCGVRVVDKSRAGTQYRIELWLRGRDRTVCQVLHDKASACLVDGLSTKNAPSLTFKEHNP